MNQELVKAFSNDKFGNVRVVLVGESQEPYFVGKDVAECLGYSNVKNAVPTHVDDEDKLSTQIEYAGQKRNVTVINESGLYSLVLSSKLPQAKDFKRWVTSEVLPSIRKNGTYMTDNTIEKVLTDPDFLIKLATQLKEEKSARQALEVENQKKQEIIEMQEPKVAFANAITASKNSILVRELARLISQNGVKMGEQKLYAWMRENEYVEKHSCKATQKAINLKVLELIERTSQDKEGNLHTNFTTYVTPKGQEYFIKKFICKEEQGA